jgi:hypothetical protein
VFGKQGNSKTDSVDAALKIMGISSEKIRQSHAFEEQVNALLGGWIDEYSRRIIELSYQDSSDPLYPTNVAQTKILLMSIYHQAEVIAESIKEEGSLQVYKNASPILDVALQRDFPQPIVFSDSLLMAYAAQMQNNGEPKAEGGSCPAIEDASNPFSLSSAFPDSLSILNTLIKGSPVESSLKKVESFNCPKCGAEIPSGKGIEVCPHCGISKQKHAEMVNGTQCD